MKHQYVFEVLTFRRLPVFPPQEVPGAGEVPE